MKKIVFVTGSMCRGGAERVISLLANQYAARGWQVRIAMLLHDRVEYPLADGVEVCNLSNDRVRPILDIPRMITALRRMLRQEKPDVLVGFLREIIPVTDLACAGLPLRRVYSERNDPSASRMNALYEKLLVRALTGCDCAVMQTERARAFYPERVRRNSVVIPNPVSVQAVAAPQRRCRIVTAGRLEAQKNHRMLIAAFAALHARHPGYTLDIYGEGSLRQALEAQIAQAGLTDCVRLPGSVPDLHARMADAEMFVLPSDYEGLSNALLEAMMMGLPCIATCCAGSDEAIEDGVNGLLIPVGDEAALTQALFRLVEDRQTARDMGGKAAADAARYRAEHVMHLWRKAIEG